MTLANLEQSLCLPSQRIRELMRQGVIISELDENRIQPSSFEPTIGDEIFILDTQPRGTLRPSQNETVYRSLLQLPMRERRKENMAGGFEIKREFSYLIKLEEKLTLSPDKLNYVKSSPKSSFGRVFLNTRLLADYNPCFDEAHAHYKQNIELDLWLLVQPLAFNHIIYPGLSLNQLRFFDGQNFKLTDNEILDEFSKSPLLWEVKDNAWTSATPIVRDGLQIHLNLRGENTGGIIGLRARNNPEPIDLKAKGKYKAEDFFEPMKGDLKITGVRGEHYLFSSLEVLDVPSHLAIELKNFSHIGFTGPLHFAGFVDNGFKGDLVFEVRSDEIGDVTLNHGMPLSRLDVFRTGEADKTYGATIGSNYQLQTGTRPAKFFMPFDFESAARNYRKLDRDVMVNDAALFKKLRTKKEGFEFIEPSHYLAINQMIETSFFHSRYDCEEDESILQPIPYILIINKENKVFEYVRAKHIRDYGDVRLFEKHSIGVGGHIDRKDKENVLLECIKRELEEEVKFTGAVSEPKLVGTLMAHDEAVDRVHFGLIYLLRTDGDVKPNSKALEERSGKFVSIDELARTVNSNNYETWSKILVPHLNKIIQEYSF